VNFEKYKTLIFDCDGVVLNSNIVKTQAFYNAALPYGEEAALKLIDYHVKNGGISRYKKFEKFISSFIEKEIRVDISSLLKAYASEVWSGLLSCEVAPRLNELRLMTKHISWLIVSGGDEEELRNVFAVRKLSHLFDGGIYGSPTNKDEILSREISRGSIMQPALFFGDSRYDYEAANRAGLDFCFVRNWSESMYDFENADFKIDSLQDLLVYLKKS